MPPLYQRMTTQALIDASRRQSDSVQARLGQTPTIQGADPQISQPVPFGQHVPGDIMGNIMRMAPAGSRAPEPPAPLPMPDLATLMQSEALQMSPGPFDRPPAGGPGDPSDPLMQNLAGLEAARARANLELTGPVTTQAPASMLMPDLAQPPPPTVAGPAATPARTAAAAVAGPAMTPARTAAPGGQAAASSPAGSSGGMMPALGSPTMSLPGVPPPPALDPRRGTPSVTPTSNDPNDRSPENTVGQDEGLFGVSNDIWETLLEAGLRTMAAGEQGMSTLGALGTGGLEALQGLRGRRREEASDARQREIEDRQYALDRMMVDLQAEEARRPQYQMVQDASGNLIAIDTRNPANTIDTGIDQRVPGTGGRSGTITPAQRLQMFQAATQLVADLAEQGIDISLDEALAQVERFMTGQGSAASGSYDSAEAVREAYQNGRISYDEAAQILVNQFGFEL